MKCLCFSDTHGSISVMQTALKLHPDAKVVFFLGDGILDAEYLLAADSSRAWIMVAGNCDPRSVVIQRNLKYTDSVTLEGMKISLTHGHKYEVKFGLDRLVYFAEETDSDIVLFGHTHVPYEKFIRLPSGKELRFFNPGSAQESGYDAPSYGVLTIKDGGVLFSHGYIT